MFRSLLILSVTACSLLEPVSALNASKKRLCTEICWINDINNYDSCADRCYNSGRPTDDEADACESCIDTCAIDYLGNNPCLVVYTECRRGCFHKYFPMFMPSYKGNSKKRRSVSKIPRELPEPAVLDKFDGPEVHAPGVPNEFRKLLAGTDYPVGIEVCQIACRVKLQDTILSDKDDAEECIYHCLQYPTHRDQELQVALDCGNKCPAEAAVFSKRDDNGNIAAETQPCLQTCASEMINERKASASAAPRPTRTQKQQGTSPSGYANKAQKTGAQKYVDSFNNSNASPTTSTGVRKSSGGSGSYEVVEAKSAAMNYFQSPQFLFHAACTMIVASAIGLHMI